MAGKQDPLKEITAHAKEYGFIFPSSEIYDGLGATYDYGPNGVELRDNLKRYWWRCMVQLNENVVGLDAAIFMHPRTWEASGHLESFNDPMVDNKDSKKRYRADQLLEDKIEQLRKKKKNEQAETLASAFADCMERNDLAGLGRLIERYEITDPESGSRNWSEVRQFNLMFGTRLGALAEGANDLYLRPETAQGIFVNFLNVQKTTRQKLPFGIAQTGKAFRNEIVARQFLFRMREFEQMEMQFFVRPGTEMEWFEHWKEKRLRWHRSLGIAEDRLRLHAHETLAHYANAAVDLEYQFPIGFKEVEGVHSRTDFDLSRHQAYSGKKLQYFDPEQQSSYLPYVVETSIGLDRLFLMVFNEALQTETLQQGEKTSQRTVMKLPAFLAPNKVAILPLTRKDGLPETALKIFEDLRLRHQCFYEEKDNIGKRYRRQDAIGTPYCITVDHQTQEDQTVTLRYRDSMEQRRISIGELKTVMEAELDITEQLKAL